MIKNAVIFAAGKGTRLSPLTEYTPKPLIKIHSYNDAFGEPIVERNIRFLQESGIKNITIVVGYLKEQFNYLTKKFGVKLVENNKYDEENNIASLGASLNEFSSTLYVEGDIYLKENIFPELIKQIAQNNYKSMFFGAKDEGINEWAYILNNKKNIIGHELKKLGINDYKWTGIAYINEHLAKLMQDNFAEYYAQEENKQQYFETFIWTLKDEIKLGVINTKDFYELDNFGDLVKIDSFYQTQDEIKLWTPGPTNIDDNIGSVILKGIVHHRSPLANYYIANLYENLKGLFKTKVGVPLLITASGTGIMEATVQNIVNEGDEIIAISSGDFGDRFIQMLEIYKAKIHKFRYPENTTFNIDDFKDLIPHVKAVFITHHETSTGVLHDIKKIGEYTKNTDTLLVVDSVSSIINEDLQFDNWGLDIAFASSAKGFSLAPGFSIVCASPKAIKAFYECTNKRFYFDFRKYIEYFNSKGQTPFTPNISLLVSMNASIEIMNKISIEKIQKDKREIYDYLDEKLTSLGFKNIVPKEIRTVSMLCMQGPDGLNCRRMRDEINNKKLIYFEVGRNEMAEKSLRIGIPNLLTMQDAQNLYFAIKEYLSEKHYK